MIWWWWSISNSSWFCLVRILPKFLTVGWCVKKMRNCYPGVREATEGCFLHPRIAIALLIGESGIIVCKLWKICQIVAKCEHEFYSTLCKVCTWVLLNTLLQFHEFFLILCVFVVFNNVNTVRSEMWVWGFPNHSCQKFLTNHSSSTRDLTRFLAFVIWKTPYSHFLLTVFSY